MTVKELNKEEMNELKFRYYSEKTGKELSYNEMFEINKYVSDKEIIKEYQDVSFVKDDFICNINKEEVDYEY